MYIKRNTNWYILNKNNMYQLVCCFLCIIVCVFWYSHYFYFMYILIMLWQHCCIANLSMWSEMKWFRIVFMTQQYYVCFTKLFILFYSWVFRKCNTKCNWVYYCMVSHNFKGHVVLSILMYGHNILFYLF